ncbi:MAG: hypothetical protein BWX63_00704 [Bacteroidetes bacterium ADurb.Bin041]|nr:MAG: hypothetical protein BWX63_00704 [Bacteroidetes bacterium ADurb.Bin041]
MITNVSTLFRKAYVTSKPKKETDSITMKFLLHKNKKNRNANAQNSTSCKTHRPSHGTIFAARAFFLHTHVSSTKYRLKPKLFNHGL